MNAMSKTIIAITSLVLMLGSTASLAGTANAQYEQTSQAAKSKTPDAAAKKSAAKQQKLRPTSPEHLKKAICSLRIMALIIRCHLLLCPLKVRNMMIM
ncbi:hypothetical protein [Paenibacillus apiarius]|uniref:hypothetical protein n=1 Tax=Paenibacillus apiarius TaxID=46240 RepID=UPI003B3AA08D